MKNNKELLVKEVLDLQYVNKALEQTGDINDDILNYNQCASFIENDLTAAQLNNLKNVHESLIQDYEIDALGICNSTVPKI